jgi:uncharacterized membrane protein
MTTPKKLRNELFKQDRGSACPGADWRDKVLARDAARVARMKTLTIFAWVVVAASLAAGLTVRAFFPEIREYQSALVPAAILVFQALLMIAAFFTLALYIRSRTLTMRQIQASLAHIEEHLKKMAEKE